MSSSPNSILGFSHAFAILTLTVVFSTQALAQQNIVCNPGFDNYSLTPQIDAEAYCFASSDISCWFNEDYNSKYEVKRKENPPVGNVAELFSNVNYTLCQNLVLEQNSTYELTFNIVNSMQMSWSQIYVGLNSLRIYTIKTLRPFSVSKGSSIFLADADSAKLCFTSNFENKITIMTEFDGPSIDNITVVKLASTITIIPVYCSTSSQNFLEVILTCKYQYTGNTSYLEQISRQKSFLIYLEEEILQDFDVEIHKNNSFTFKLYPKRAYDLTKITIQLSSNQGKTSFSKNFDLKFYIDGQECIFIYLSEQQQVILKSTKQFAQKIIGITNYVYSVLKATFLSFFLINIISFWNLSLMYYFLNISTVPAFCKQFMERLIFQFFSLSSIIEWFSQKFPSIKDPLNVSNIGGRELMQKFEHRFAWFQTFGLSSKYLVNNLQTLLIEVWLIIKLLLFFVLRKLLKQKFYVVKRFGPKGCELLLIFLKENLSFFIFMTVSAATCVKSQGFIKFDQKLNQIIQTISLLLYVLVIPAYFLNNISIQLKKYQKKLRKNKIRPRSGKQELRDLQPSKQQIQQRVKQQRKIRLNIMRRINLTTLTQVFDYAHYIIIPFMVVMKNTDLFIICCTITISSRCYFFMKYRKKINSGVKDQIFEVTNLIFWLTYHYTFLALWIFHKIFYLKDSSAHSRTYQSYYKIGGFVILFILIAGGLMQIIKFALEVLCLIVKIIAKIIRKCFKKEKKQQKPNAAEEDETKQDKLKISKIQNVFKVGLVSQNFLNFSKVLSKNKTNKQTSNDVAETNVLNKKSKKSDKIAKPLLKSSPQASRQNNQHIFNPFMPSSLNSDCANTQKIQINNKVIKLTASIKRTQLTKSSKRVKNSKF